MNLTRPSEIHNAWSNLISLQAGQLTMLGISVLSTVVVSRLLGPEKFGAFSLFLVIAQYAVIVSVNWTTSAVVRFGKAEFLQSQSVRRVFWTRLALIVPCLALASVALLLLWDRLSALTGLPSYYLALVLAMMFALTLADQMDGALQATSRWKRYAWLGVVEKATFLFGILGLSLFAGSPLVLGAIILAIGSQLARIAIGALSLIRAGLVLPITVDRSILRQMLTYASPQIFVFTIGYASAFVEPLIIKWFADVRQVGIYQVAFQTNIFLALLLTPLSTLMFPMATSLRLQNRQDLVLRFLTRIVPQFVLAMNLVMIIGMSAAIVFFPLLFGAAFDEGLAPLLILFASTAFQVVTMLYSPILAAYDLTKEYAAINVLGGIFVHLPSELLLISPFGIVGAAASWLVWYIFSAIACVYVVNRRLAAQTYWTLFIPILALGGLCFALFVSNALLQQFLIIALIIGALGLAKRQRVFQRADLAVLAAIGAPAFLQKIAVRAYALL